MEPAACPPPPRPVDFFVVGLPLTLNGADDSAVQSHFNALIEPVLPSNAVTNNPASLSAGNRCPRSCLYSTVSQQRALRTNKPPEACNVRVTTRILRIGCRMKFQDCHVREKQGRVRPSWRPSASQYRLQRLSFIRYTPRDVGHQWQSGKCTITPNGIEGEVSKRTWRRVTAR